MTTSFPTGLDALTNPTGSSSLTSPDHAGQHADINDAVEALEAKVGVNSSAVTSSLDYKIANIPATSITTGTLNNSRLPAAATTITSVGTLTGLTVAGNTVGTKNFGDTFNASFSAKADSSAQGLLAGYSFNPTFMGTGDNGVRRAADIWAGYNGGAWGNEYLSFGVGTGAGNDVGAKTTERMRIDGAGNVGIGTSSPASYGLLSASASISASTTKNMLAIRQSAGVDSATMRIAGYAYTGNARTAIDFVQNAASNFNSQMVFSTSAGADAVERMRINGAGNVGIGTSSPSQPLDVNGVAKATQFLQGTDYHSPYQGFRNAIINGDFRINQRAFTSSTTSSLYGFDRWLVTHVGGTCTQSAQTFTVGSPAATGYESANYLQFVTASQSAASDFAKVRQFVEDVRTFANSTVTVSFWAKATSGTPKVALELNQGFGTGGSPSAEVNVYGGQVTLSTSWARYSVTVAVPSISGKTIGTTANTSSLGIDFWTSSGSTYNARSGSLGIQNNTFHFWGVQVERGSVATPFEQRPIQQELALCQRYYEKSYSINTAPGTNTTAGQLINYGSNDLFLIQVAHIKFSVPKRTSSYTMTGYTTGGTSGQWGGAWNGGFGSVNNTVSFSYPTEFSVCPSMVITGSSAATVTIIQGHWVCNAEL